MIPKKKILYLIILFFFLTSCKSSFELFNVSEQAIQNTGLIYILPKTKILLNIEHTEIHKQKGPFSEYTGLYFNSKNSIQNNEVEYKITDVSITSIPIKDEKNVFALNSYKNASVSMLNLTPEGFLAGINLSDYQAEKIQSEQKTKTNSIIENSKLDYADFSLKSIRETQYDTIYKEVMQDSVIIRVPIITQKKVYKTIDKQAKEIADIIFLLRDDRNALLKGENDGNNFPDGEALKIMLEELNNLEKQYMSLFTGREVKVIKNNTYEIIPDNNKLTYQLFRFNNKIGVSSDSLHKPVILKIYPDLSIPVIKNFNQPNFNEIRKKGNPYKGIIYRVPADVVAEISFDNIILYKKLLRIPQMGTVNLISDKIINDETTIEFYPELGSLKRISNDQTKNE